jgi:hypothetical protein
MTKKFDTFSTNDLALAFRIIAASRTSDYHVWQLAEQIEDEIERREARTARITEKQTAEIVRYAYRMFSTHGARVQHLVQTGMAAKDAHRALQAHYDRRNSR